MPSYQKLQCRLSAPYILVACDGGLQRKKINTDDHLSMCSCSGGTELDKAAKFRISRSAWCTFSRGEQIRGYVHRENEHRGARLRGGGGGGTNTLLHRPSIPCIHGPTRHVHAHVTCTRGAVGESGPAYIALRPNVSLFYARCHSDYTSQAMWMRACVHLPMCCQCQ